MQVHVYVGVHFGLLQDRNAAGLVKDGHGRVLVCWLLADSCWLLLDFEIEAFMILKALLFTSNV